MSDLKNKNCAIPSFEYILAGLGVVLLSSITMLPSNSFSIGVTLQIIPVLAYVLFPTQIQRTSFGILKYSTVLAKTNEFGGMIHSET